MVMKEGFLCIFRQSYVSLFIAQTCQPNNNPTTFVYLFAYTHQHFYVESILGRNYLYFEVTCSKTFVDLWICLNNSLHDFELEF